MADEPKVTNHVGVKAIAPSRHWLANNSTTVIFLIIVAALVAAIGLQYSYCGFSFHRFPAHRDWH